MHAIVACTCNDGMFVRQCRKKRKSKCLGLASKWTLFWLKEWWRRNSQRWNWLMNANCAR